MKGTHMKQEITLKNALMVTGAKIKTLTYDVEEVTAALFMMAEGKKLVAVGTSGNRAGAIELDYSFQLYLGFAAIIAVNPNIDFSDLERVKGVDVMQITRIGRNFITLRLEERLPEENSEEQSGTTPAPSTPQSETSSKKD